METRPLGRTGHRSTIIALGGAAFISNPSESEAESFMRKVLDHGVNHIDVAPTYGDAETRLGKWVKEYRKNFFLACKTRHRTGKEAASELRRSLTNLQTDYFDLYQLHGLDTAEELETALAPGGAIETILEAKRQGLVEHIGITSHNPINIIAALNRYNFDTVLLPVNYVLGAHPQPENDYKSVLEVAKERNIGIIAMKTIAKGPWPNERKPYNTWYEPFSTPQEITEALCFTLSQYVSTAVTSSDMKLASMTIDAAEHYAPMSEIEQAELLSRAFTYRPLFPRQ